MSTPEDGMQLQALARGGRLVLDEPVDLPEGTEADRVTGAEDELDDEDRRCVEAAIDRGLADARAGRTVPAEAVMAALRAKRRR
jgi:predicted transcriptional regulator